MNCSREASLSPSPTPATLVFFPPSFVRYGGEMLGPVRFSHFETCAREVCRTFRLKDDIESDIATLTSLDDILASLREELAQTLVVRTSSLDPNDDASLDAAAAAGGGGASRASPKKTPNYKDLRDSLDVNKAKRLITARENSIKSVKSALKREKDKAG